MARDEWWRGAAIYQIYPRSFQDTTGDGIGDLAGIARRMGHVAALGVDAIWISPFFTSPMQDMGYDISDQTGVDPIFGTMADFDAVIAAAHREGLKVTIDQVLAHTSDRHAWFAESRENRENPKADWYVWADPKADGSPPNNWQSVFGGPSWTWGPRRRQYYMHNFLSSQPQLNFHSEEVQQAQLDAMRFWLDRGVDGFRLDSVNYHFHDADLTDNPPVTDREPEGNPDNTYSYQEHNHDKSRPENLAYLERIRALFDDYGAVGIGEVGDGDRSLETMAAYTRGDSRLHMAYSFDLLGDKCSPAHFRGAVESFESYCGGDGWPCWAFSNHDVMRHPSRWVRHVVDWHGFCKVTAALLMSLKGSVCLYQGEELGLPEAELAYHELTDPVGLRFWPENKGRDGARTPMPWEAALPNAGFSTAAATWLPIKPPHPAMAVDTQAGVPGSVLEFYRAFLAFRKTRPSLVRGDIRFIEGNGDGLAFLRNEGTETTLCLFNLGQDEIAFDLPAEVTTLEAGFGTTISDGRVRLPVHGAWFGDVAGAPAA